MLVDLPVGHSQKLTVDHLIPVSQGGGHGLENLRALCHGCNSRRGNRTPEQAAALVPWRDGDSLDQFDVAPYGSAGPLDW